MTIRDRNGAAIAILWILLASASPAASQHAGSAPAVLKAAFSRDGRLGVLIYEDGATLLDFENRRETCLIRGKGLGAPAFSHDGSELAIGTRWVYEDSPIGETAPYAEIRILDARSGAVKKRFADSRVVDILETAFAPAGTLYALGAKPGLVVPGKRRGYEQLLLWEATAGRVTPLLPEDRARRLNRCAAAFFPDGEALAVVYGTESAQEIRIYDTSNPSSARSIARARAVTAPVAPIGFGPPAIAPGARTLSYSAIYGYAAGTRSEIRIHDLGKKKIVRRITNLPAGLLSLAFLADGRLAALPAIAMQARLRAEDYWRTLARGSEYLGAVTIWNPSSGKIERKIDLPGDAVVSILVPERNAVVSLQDGAWSICDMDRAEIRGGITAVDPERIPALAGCPGPDEREALQSFTIHRILAVSFFPGRPGVLVGASDSGIAYLWDTASGSPLRWSRFAPSADCIAVSEDGRILAAAGVQGNRVVILEEDGGAREMELTGFDRRTSALAASRAGEALALGATDGYLGIRALGERATIRQWPGHGAAVRALAFSRDGTMLASSAEDRTVKLWNPAAGTAGQALAGHRAMVHALAFAPGQEAMLAGGGDDGRIVLWDVKLRKPVRTLEGHGGAVRSLAFSPDGSMLVSGADDGLLVWNARTGKRMRMLLRNSREWREGRRPAEGRPVGYGSGDMNVVSIRFSSDGRLVACGGTNNTAIVWDTRTWGRRTYRATDGQEKPDET